MDLTSIGQLGIGASGVLAVIMVSLVLNFLKSRRVEHNQDDRFIELVRAVERLTINMELQTKILDRMSDRIDRIGVVTGCIPAKHREEA